MLVHYFFENFYYRLFLAFLLCLLITFSHEVEALQQTWILGCLLALTLLMVFGDMYNDYGIVLLVMTLCILSYNNVRIQPSSNKLAL